MASCCCPVPIIAHRLGGHSAAALPALPAHHGGHPHASAMQQRPHPARLYRRPAAPPCRAWSASAPICFDAACAAAADRGFVVAVGLPLLVLAAWLVYLLRPLPAELKEKGSVFEEPFTGNVMGDPEGPPPERDQNGMLVYRVVSYTPWPVEPGYEGERVRIEVGPIANKQARTFVFPRLLSQPSELLTVTLPRPLGVVLEWQEGAKRAVVAELVENSNAAKKSKMASLNRELAKEVLLPGDILRGVTCTNFVYPPKALWGAIPPERHIVLYGADKMRFSDIALAMRKGEIKDGPVTVVVERRKPPAA